MLFAVKCLLVTFILFQSCISISEIKSITLIFLRLTNQIDKQNQFTLDKLPRETTLKDALKKYGALDSIAEGNDVLIYCANNGHIIEKKEKLKTLTEIEGLITPDENDSSIGIGKIIVDLNRQFITWRL